MIIILSIFLVIKAKCLNGIDINDLLNSDEI